MSTSSRKKRIIIRKYPHCKLLRVNNSENLSLYQNTSAVTHLRRMTRQQSRRRSAICGGGECFLQTTGSRYRSKIKDPPRTLLDIWHAILLLVKLVSISHFKHTLSSVCVCLFTALSASYKCKCSGTSSSYHFDIFWAKVHKLICF